MDIINKNKELSRGPIEWAEDYFKDFKMSPNGLQESILTADKQQRIVEINCFRNDGSTTGIIMGALYNALSKQNRILIISPSVNSAENIKIKMSRYLVDKTGMMNRVDRITRNEISFKNGSRISFMSSTVEAFHGTRCDKVYIDNFNLIYNSRSVLDIAVSSVIDNDGQVITINDSDILS